MTVRMIHPDLPGAEIEVASSAVPIHAGAGWQAVEGQADMGETLPAELQPFEGQPIVRLYHPDLDTQIRVAESAVPFHRERGWLVLEEEPTAKAEGEVDRLDGLTVEQLRDEARTAGMAVSGTKAELLDRLRSTPAEAGQTSEEE